MKLNVLFSLSLALLLMAAASFVNLDRSSNGDLSISVAYVQADPSDEESSDPEEEQDPKSDDEESSDEESSEE